MEQVRQRCGVCGREIGEGGGLPAELIRPALAELIRRDHPDWDGTGPVCDEDLHRYRMRLVEAMLTDESGELSELDADVLQALSDNELVAADLNEEFDQGLTFGQRVADRVAEFGGSWAFILSFGAVLAGWIALNTSALLAKPFDPYPYILLNLVLSCLAALQAPVIMMSQNRQEAKDRLRAEHDYRINLKAELEVRLLNARFEQLLGRQWSHLMEIQRIQTELMEEIATHRRTVEHDAVAGGAS